MRWIDLPLERGAYTDDRKAGKTKPLTLPKGGYSVQYAWGVNVDGVVVSAVKLTR